MKSIDVGIRLSETVLEDVTAIVGRRGRGKTNTATVMVEEAHTAGMRFCVVDPVGVWFGLRSSRDGKAAGIPVVVMGGEHAMVPLEPASGKIIADFLATPGPSVVLDFRLMRKAEMTRFMADFLERLYFKNRESLLLVLDEADKFAPQRPFGDEARMLGAAEDVVKMGRARGLHSVLITQRPATLNKNVITQAGMLVAHGLPAPQDQKAVDAWIQERADEKHRAEFLSTLGGLDRGEAWIWAPEMDVFRRVQIRERRTFDSSATPKRGERRADPKVLAEVDLEKLSAEIKASAERMKADDPRELRKALAEARSLLAKKEAVLAEVDKRTKVIDQKLARIKTVEKPVLKDAQIQRLEALVERYRKGWDWHRERLVLVQGEIDRLNAIGAATFNEIIAALRAASTRGAGQSTVAGGGGSGAAETRMAARPHRPTPVVSPRPSGGISFGKGERRVLAAVAQYPNGAARDQLTVLTGYKRSSRDAYLQRLQAAGYVTPSGAGVMATESGIAALGHDYEPPPTGDELRRYWLEKLPEGERKILAALIEVYPHSAARDDLDAVTGYKRSSRDAYIQRLVARRLVTVTGRTAVQASTELFS